jgi:hypothetical protein
MQRNFHRRSARALVMAVLMGLAPAAPAAELVRQFSGDRSTETVEFEAEAPWLIDWRVNSDFPDTMGVEVTLVNASGAYEGRVFKTERPDNGVRLMQESGRYFFKVQSTVSNWTLKVQQLTAEEAQQYAPKAQGLLD